MFPRRKLLAAPLAVVQSSPTPPKEIESRNADRTFTNGLRRVVAVTPRNPAPGLPWSWRGCYWNHESQTEIELLHRGFHICYVAPDRMHPGPGWDCLYQHLTTQHGYSPRPAHIHAEDLAMISELA